MSLHCHQASHMGFIFCVTLETTKVAKLGISDFSAALPQFLVPGLMSLFIFSWVHPGLPPNYKCVLWLGLGLSVFSEPRKLTWQFQFQVMCHEPTVDRAPVAKVTRRAVSRWDYLLHKINLMVCQTRARSSHSVTCYNKIPWSHHILRQRDMRLNHSVWSRAWWKTALKLEKTFQDEKENSVPDVRLKSCPKFKNILELIFLCIIRCWGVQSERSVFCYELSLVCP